MRIQAFQHVPFEDIGSMAADFRGRGYPVATTHWYRGDSAPNVDDFEVLIIMGGPMGVYDELEYPWLATEKKFIKEAIDAGKIVIGICLGAQLIASACHARVTHNPHKEIGWFPLIVQTKDDPLARILGNNEVFHWHGDTFELPADGVWLASSAACKHQAFRIGDNVFGFQFHLETTPESAAALIQHCQEDLDGSCYTQDAETILHSEEKFALINQVMSAVLQQILDR